MTGQPWCRCCRLSTQMPRARVVYASATGVTDIKTGLLHSVSAKLQLVVHCLRFMIMITPDSVVFCLGTWLISIAAMQPACCAALPGSLRAYAGPRSRGSFM